MPPVHERNQTARLGIVFELLDNHVGQPVETAAQINERGRDFTYKITGASNTDQFLLDLNPTNPASVFRIISVTNNAGGYMITWKTAGIKTNVVQGAVGNATGGYSNNFSDVSGWIILPVAGDTSTNYLDQSATNKYYRIRLGP